MAHWGFHPVPRMPLPGHQKIPSSAVQIIIFFISPLLPGRSRHHLSVLISPCSPQHPGRVQGKGTAHVCQTCGKQSGDKCWSASVVSPCTACLPSQLSWSLSAYPSDTIMFKDLFHCCFKYTYSKRNLGFFTTRKGRKGDQAVIVSNLISCDSLSPPWEEQERGVISWGIPALLHGKLQKVTELLPSFCPSLPTSQKMQEIAEDLLCLPECWVLREGWANTNWQKQ